MIMRTSEESSGTVLHRLIQEQLRYGNLTDTRTLLAIQQQALRGGSSNSSSSGGGSAGSPRSSLESLTQEESQYVQMSTRQEPQGQEHQGDCPHSESPVCHLYQLHGEELPTYEQAKAHSQYLISQQGRAELAAGPGVDIMGSSDEGQWDMKREHTRSLSERLMQLSLERNGPRESPSMSSSHSYPQLYSDIPDPAVARNGQEATDPRGPPPEYPFCVRIPGYMLSHSQEHGHYYKEPPPPFHSPHHRYVSAHNQVANNNIYPSMGPAVPELSGVAPNNNQLQMDLLMQENARLKKEVEAYAEKAARLQKLESEIQRISEAYETLMKGSAKRETLEKTMRNKLEAEIKRLHDFNRDLRDRLETANKQRLTKEAESTDQKRHVFAKLLEQNEDQQREREHLERQLQHLRVSGDEWMRRRDVLEQALSSAQARNQQLEEELQRKRAYVEKVERLQSALAQLQAACEKREALELRLRTRLEQELKSLRAQQWQFQSQVQAGGPITSELVSATLQQQLREREERILALEADITKWEQKYLEESTMRQFAMDAAATAAAQRDTTIIRHSPRHSPDSSFNDDLPLSGHRHQEMENRIRVLHAQLLEKDAVIKVLQQRSRWEQGRLEKQGLRLARSFPSINTVASGPADCAAVGKGKSLSDDQTAAAALLPPYQRRSLPPQAPSRDSSTQSDFPSEGAELTSDSPVMAASEASTSENLEESKAQLNTFKTLTHSDADVVEILI